MYAAAMPLDTQARMLLDQMASVGAPPLNEQSVEQARAMIENLAALSGEAEPVAAVDNRAIPGPAGEIPIRLYRPESAGAGAAPCLVWLHGGGFVIGSIDTSDGTCRALANRTGAVVVSVDYRLAPEDPFPAGPEDAYTAVTWIAANGTDLGIDPSRIAVGGDSAGGNLTAVVALMARDRGGPDLRFQLLVYPVTDHSFETRSYLENADGYLLTRDAMIWFWDHYIADPVGRDDPYASPLRAGDVSGLPPAFVITAEYDPLRDEGEAYADKLRAAGVPVTLTRYDGMIHGFFGMSLVLNQAKQAIDDAAVAVRDALKQ
jgi:acetyl esterase